MHGLALDFFEVQTMILDQRYVSVFTIMEIFGKRNVSGIFCLILCYILSICFDGVSVNFKPFSFRFD